MAQSALIDRAQQHHTELGLLFGCWKADTKFSLKEPLPQTPGFSELGARQSKGKISQEIFAVLKIPRIQQLRLEGGLTSNQRGEKNPKTNKNHNIFQVL